MTTPVEPTEERWAYAGERLDRKGGKMYAWQTPVDESLVFYDAKTKIAGGVIGGIYEVACIRGPGDSLRVRGLPKFSGERLDEAGVVAGWQAQHAGARQQVALAAAERRMAASGPLDEAMSDLEALAAGLRTWADIDALCTEVNRRLRRAWDKRST